MRLTARQRTALAIGFLSLAGLGFLSYKFFLPQLQIYRETAADVAERERDLARLKKDFGNYSNPKQYLDELQPTVAMWEDAYARRAKTFTTTLRKIPASVKTPEFYFNEQWKETRDRLLEKARRLNAIIPVDVGFGDGIPAPEQVETLLNQLSNVEYMLNLALDCGVTQITSFSVGTPIDKSGFIQIIPIQIGFVAPMDVVKKFLYYCGYGSQYVKVEAVSLSAVRDPYRGTGIQLQALLTTTWVQDKPVVTAAPETTPGGEFGFGGLFGRMRGTGGEGRTTDEGFGGGLPMGPGGSLPAPSRGSR